MSGEPLLVVEGLETCYGAIAALHGISFEVPASSVVALVGANGAGKSTTLNTISGLLAPRAGLDPLRRAGTSPAGAPTGWRRCGLRARCRRAGRCWRR